VNTKLTSLFCKRREIYCLAGSLFASQELLSSIESASASGVLRLCHISACAGGAHKYDQRRLFQANRRLLTAGAVTASPGKPRKQATDCAVEFFH
jgi:hypothetical protein